MPRSPLPAPPAFVRPALSALEALDISVITPLFGGGVIAHTVDTERPVSGKTVRGQLRFWWRACFAHRFRDTEALFNEEARLWGAAAGTSGGPGLVDVTVSLKQRGRAQPACVPLRQPSGTFRRDFGAFPGYALFPFQGDLDANTGNWRWKDGIKQEPSLCLRGVAFRLELHWARHALRAPLDGEQIRAALWAWIRFGGVGARTRRGCGSLAAPTWRPFGNNADITAEWAKVRAIAGQCSPGTPDHVHPLIPTISGGSLLLGRPFQASLPAWMQAVERMRLFRQGPAFAREPGAGNRPGLSRWPEADGLRNLIARQNATRPAHQQLKAEPHTPRRPDEYYPRTNLGLPLRLEQFNGRTPVPEFSGATKDRERMASPVILKAVAVSDRDYRPVALLLRAPNVWDAGTPGVRLEYDGGEWTLPTANLTNPALDNVIVTPPDEAGLPTWRGNARDQFMAYAAKSWGSTKVTMP